MGLYGKQAFLYVICLRFYSIKKRHLRPDSCGFVAFGEGE